MWLKLLQLLSLSLSALSVCIFTLLLLSLLLLLLHEFVPFPGRLSSLSHPHRSRSVTSSFSWQRNLLLDRFCHQRRCVLNKQVSKKVKNMTLKIVKLNINSINRISFKSRY
jgi:hypothetical protein